MRQLLELRQQKAELTEKMKALLSTVQTESRSLSEAESSKFSAFKSDIEQLNQKIECAEIVDNEERAMIGGSQSVRTGNLPSNAEIRSFITGETRSLSVGIAENGGHAVPNELDSMIMAQLRDGSVFRQNALNASTTSHKLDKLVSVGGTSAGWAGEGDTRTETNTSTLKKVTVEVNEIYAYPKTTNEIMNHAQIDLASWLTTEVATEMLLAEEAAFWNGDGVKKPKGLLTYTRALTADATRAFGTVQKLETAAVGVIAGDDLVSLAHTLRQPYRANAKYFMNDSTFEAIRKIKDNEGNYLWRAGIGEGESMTLLGKPVEIAEEIADDLIVYGDLTKAYMIVDKPDGTTMQPDSITSPGFYKVYTQRYVGGALLDSNAVKFLEVKTV